MKALRTSLAILMLCVGCDDADKPSDSGDTGADEPLYAVSSNSYNEDLTEESSLLWLVKDLQKGSLRPADAIELPGGATLWGIPKSGVLYVVSGDDLSVTKYTVKAGKLVEAGKLGLGSSGITSLIGELMVFDGPDRGYLFELQSAQALRLDLAKMEITGSIDLSDVVIGELSLLGGPTFRKHGDKLVNTVYGVSATYERVAPESKLLILDPKTGKIETRSAPCAGLAFSVEAANGDLYFSTDAYVAAVHLLDETAGPAPCLARLQHDHDDFDEDTVALNDVTGAPTGGLVAGPSGSAYLRVLDKDKAPKAADSGWLDLYSATAWQTWSIDLRDPSSATHVDHAALGGSIKVFDIDGHSYQSETTEDFATTKLVETTDKDASQTGLEMPGTTWGIVRLQ